MSALKKLFHSALSIPICIRKNVTQSISSYLFTTKANKKQLLELNFFLQAISTSIFVYIFIHKIYYRVLFAETEEVTDAAFKALFYKYDSTHTFDIICLIFICNNRFEKLNRDLLFTDIDIGIKTTTRWEIINEQVSNVFLISSRHSFVLLVISQGYYVQIVQILFLNY